MFCDKRKSQHFFLLQPSEVKWSGLIIASILLDPLAEDCHARLYPPCKEEYRTTPFSRQIYGVLQGRQKSTHHHISKNK